MTLSTFVARPFVRQLTGGVCGALMALLLYGAYQTIVEPAIASLVVEKTPVSPEYDVMLGDEQRQRQEDVIEQARARMQAAGTRL